MYGSDIRLVTMTATPVSENGYALELLQADRSHPILTRRLQASKQAKLINAPNAEKDFVKATVEAAVKFIDNGQVIGVVVNRVATARRIWKALVKQKVHAKLLIGRVRPYDRDLLMKQLFPEICAGRKRKKGRPLVIVATQTIEVGADIDFDGLVTEAAPLDALRQRFGRLDRLGEMVNTKAVILYRESQRDTKKSLKPDPIYGTAIQDSWEWLQAVANNGSIDFGIAAMEEKMQRLAPPTTETKDAPVLLPSHIKLLSQTGPESPKIDVSPWLHGAGRASSDISIVWRADLISDDPTKWDVVSLRPPLTREALEIPLYAARAWLQGQRIKDVTDIEGVPSQDAAFQGSGKPVLRWRGPDDFKIIQPEEIISGDTIVVPATYGGCDEYGWDPSQKLPVKDIADYCSLERKASHVVRLVPGLIGWMENSESSVLHAVAEVIAAETEVDPEMGVDMDRIRAAHSSLQALLKDIDHPLITAFRHRFEIELHPLGVVLRGRVLDEVDGTLSGGVAVQLTDHLDGVAKKTDPLGSLHAEREKIKLAAQLHDLGKKERRFQIMLYGDPFAAAAGPALAKSGLRKLAEKNAAYAQSGLPRGFRHELASLALSKENDPLVCHLVGTHHGYGRPWFPVCHDPDALGYKKAELNSGWLNAFATLMKNYNPWLLAGMELILRAADARQSMAEQEAANV
jgi:CRISPR-associated endonuclease/helicase Cas3